MTIFETIAAVLAGLVALALVAWGLNTVFSNLKLSETEQGLVTLRMQVQHLFNGTDYSGLDNSLVISSGIAPDSFVKGARLVNSWGGDITVTPFPADAAFSVELTAVPQRECTKLARFQTDAWMSVDVNGTDVKGGTVADAANACTTSNVIAFMSR